MTNWADVVNGVRPLNPCASGQCTYLVPDGVLYCCAPCGDAWEAKPRYEPHAHSEGCQQRQAERAGAPS